jgi:hypothetical protein
MARPQRFDAVPHSSRVEYMHWHRSGNGTKNSRSIFRHQPTVIATQ